MKGSRLILALAAVLLVLGASTLWAQVEYAIPLDKVVGAGRTSVKFDVNVYTFLANDVITVRFEKLDRLHVKLTVKPVVAVSPYREISVQWSTLPPVGLTIGSSGENSFILNTETGYAEK